MKFLKLIVSIVFARVKDNTVTELVQMVLDMYATVKGAEAMSDATRSGTQPSSRNIGGDFKAQLRGAVTTYFYQHRGK